MRPKKDPDIRKEAFIAAATGLFKDQGYAAVSVRNILDAVGDKSTSTGIFYYYFASKDELYQECVKNVAASYIAGFDDGICEENDSAVHQLIKYLQNIELSLEKYPRLIIDESAANRLFILDMKEKVTEKLIEEGRCFFLHAGLASESNADHITQFICGGIGEMIFLYRTRGMYGTLQIRELVDHIAEFSMGAFPLSKEQREEIRKGICAYRSEGM